MIDLSQELDELSQRLLKTRPVDGRGRVLLFTAPAEGLGASLVAREFARIAARRLPRGVWLYDLDFSANPQYRAFAAPDSIRRSGAPGKALNASLGQPPFWKANGDDIGHAVTLHRIGESRLFVSRFNPEAMPATKSLTVRSASDYWNAVRKTVDLAIIDAPSPQRSKAGLAFYGEADGVVFITDGRRESSQQAARMAGEVDQRGGLPAGVIVNRLPSRPRAA